MNPIVRHYERCLKKYGPTARGMDWPDESPIRYEVMLGVVRTEDPSILDLGCGCGLLRKHFGGEFYWGIDISEKMVAAAKEAYPADLFECRDVVACPLPHKCVEYVVMNGALTEKVSLSQQEMVQYAQNLIRAAYNACSIGIAFNVMSTHVDWQRDDLFHWALDDMTHFVVQNCSLNIVIRMDYGLYEYTVYVYR